MLCYVRLCIVMYVCMYVCFEMNEWMNEWMNDWLTEWMNEWIYVHIYICIYLYIYTHLRIYHLKIIPTQSAYSIAHGTARNSTDLHPLHSCVPLSFEGSHAFLRFELVNMFLIHDGFWPLKLCQDWFSKKDRKKPYLHFRLEKAALIAERLIAWVVSMHGLMTTSSTLWDFLLPARRGRVLPESFLLASESSQTASG